MKDNNNFEVESLGLPPDRQFVIDIIDVFDELLNGNDITIPDEDDDQREPDNTARIYGMTYGNLESKLTEMIDDRLVESLVEKGYGDTTKLIDILMSRFDEVVEF